MGFAHGTALAKGGLIDAGRVVPPDCGGRKGPLIMSSARKLWILLGAVLLRAHRSAEAIGLASIQSEVG